MDAIWAWLQTSNWPAHEPWTLITILLMGGVTVLARSFFFISQTPWHLPRWAQRGLEFAPIAALSAVVLPEIVMTHGVFIHTLLDARLYGAIAGAAYFFGAGVEARPCWARLCAAWPCICLCIWGWVGKRGLCSAAYNLRKLPSPNPLFSLTNLP